MTRLDMYWKSNPDWWYYDEEFREILRDDAPEEAKESYKHYEEQLERDIS